MYTCILNKLYMLYGVYFVLLVVGKIQNAASSLTGQIKY